jgi:hypothetical protein
MDSVCDWVVLRTYKANPTPPPDMEAGAVVVKRETLGASVGRLGAEESDKAASKRSILMIGKMGGVLGSCELRE